MKEHLFVNIMMLLQVGAIVNYSMSKSWSLAIYWFACFLINFVVTYTLGK